MPCPKPIAVGLLPVAVGLGTLAALSPTGLGRVLALAACLGLLLYCLRRPTPAFCLAFVCVLLAETKFRMRDPAALLAGDVDGQILFELGLYGCIALIVLRYWGTARHHPHRATPGERMLGAYVVLALLSALWAAEPRLTAVRGGQLALLYALGYVSVRVLGPQTLLRTCTSAVVGYVLVCALLALLFPWANGTRVTQGSQIARFTWFALHPISAGAYAATGVLLLCSAGLFAPGAWRQRCLGLPLWLPGALLGLVLLATRARGALLACAVTLLVLGLQRYVNPWLVRGVSYGLLTVLAMGLGLGYSLHSAVGHTLGQGTPLASFLLRGQMLDEFFSLTGRVELWQSVYTLFLEQPLCGYGYVASRVLLIKVLPWAGEAHNALAESLLNVGGVGTLLLWGPLLGALGHCFWRLTHSVGPVAWYRASLGALLLFLLCHALVDAAFAGAPGVQVLLVCLAVSATGHCQRLSVPALWPLAGALSALASVPRTAWGAPPVPQGGKLP